MNTFFNMDSSYEQLYCLIKERTMFLQTYYEDGEPRWLKPDIDLWKCLYIFETKSNIIFLGSIDEILKEERSNYFKYIVLTNLTKGSLAFTEGITMIMYNHFNNYPILSDIVIETMIKNGIDRERLIKKGNTILLDDKKISGFFCESRGGFTSEGIFITMNFNKTLIENGFNFSDDLIYYSGIKNIYQNFNEIMFYSDLQQEILKDKTEYIDNESNVVISLINDDVQKIDLNYVPDKKQYYNPSIKIDDAIRILTCRKLYDLYEGYKIRFNDDIKNIEYTEFINFSSKKLEYYGFSGKTIEEQFNNFIEYNKIKSWESYKNSRPILGYCDLCNGNLDEKGNPTGPLCGSIIEKYTRLGNTQIDINCKDYVAREATDYIYYLALQHASLPEDYPGVRKIKRIGNIFYTTCPPGHGFYVDETMCRPNPLPAWRGITVIDNYIDKIYRTHDYFISLDTLINAASKIDYSGQWIENEENNITLEDIGVTK